jgi:hypothetical protein
MEPLIPLGEISMLAVFILYGYWMQKREQSKKELTRPFKKGEK